VLLQISYLNASPKWCLCCCDRKGRAASAESFTLWPQATTEIIRRNHSSRKLVILFNRSQPGTGRNSTPQSLYHCLFGPRINGCYSSRTSRSWWIAHSTQRQPRGCNNVTEVFHFLLKRCLLLWTQMMHCWISQ